MNKVIYGGRLTKDAEVRELKNEKKTKTIYFTIACQDDFNRERADFINCQAFGINVPYLNKYGKKGAYIEFSGKTSTYSNGDKHGQIAVADKVNIVLALSKKEETKKEDTDETPVF